MTHPDTTALTERLASLDDEQAITVLAAVATRRGYHPDLTTAGQQDQHLREALAQPEITTFTPTPSSQGDLARTALTQLATTDPDTTALIDRALQMPPNAERDPALLFGIGALVLYAFHTDIDLRRDPEKGWSFRFRTKALSDSTIGKLLGQLLGSYLGPDK